LTPGRLTVTSRDGTAIAASVGGDGAPVVLVHGTTGSDFSWALVRGHLETRHRVIAVQRRGRGRSGDGPRYSLAREAEDVATVVDSLARPVGLVGHSFGGSCCLEAALLTTNVSHLVLYEPAVGWPVDQRLLAEVDALVASGRGEEATESYLRAAGLSDAEIEALRSAPTWAERVAAAHTLSREDRAAAAQEVSAERFSRVSAPALLLTGGESPPEYRASTDRVAAALPDSAIRVLEGHGHGAIATAPELVATEIVAFLERPRRD
jgi:pimeloyl-ACP methyl ester carboxylesterase